VNPFWWVLLALDSIFVMYWLFCSLVPGEASGEAEASMSCALEFFELVAAVVLNAVLIGGYFAVRYLWRFV
jgi:hypothetical protein